MTSTISSMPAYSEKRFGFEETAWLLLFGELPDVEKLAGFRNILAECRELPELFCGGYDHQGPLGQCA